MPEAESDQLIQSCHGPAKTVLAFGEIVAFKERREKTVVRQLKVLHVAL